MRRSQELLNSSFEASAIFVRSQSCGPVTDPEPPIHFPGQHEPLPEGRGVGKQDHCVFDRH